MNATRTRTSRTDPLQIATLPVGSRQGAIGITFAPGKKQAHPMSGAAWDRDLDLDLAAIRAWGATNLVTLLEPHEFTELRIEALPDRARGLGLNWHGLPIRDQHAPDATFLQAWAPLRRRFVDALWQSARIVVHCKGGIGRAGTVACMLLLDTGLAADVGSAIQMARAVRPHAVETDAQVDFLRTYARSAPP